MMLFSRKHVDEQILNALEPQMFVLHFKSFKKETMIGNSNSIRLAKELSKKVCIWIQAGSRKWLHLSVKYILASLTPV